MKDHRAGDAAVHEVLSRVARDCGRVVADLGALSDLLRSGAGLPVPGELTAVEWDFLVFHLTRVGEAGTVILAEDIARTHDRDPDLVPGWDEDDRPGGRPH